MSRQEFGPSTLSRSELLAIFDSDPRQAEEKYIALYHSLTRYFEWNRKSDPQDMAQEVLKRGFSKLQEGQKITAENPAAYFFGIARNVVREGWKARQHEQLADVDILKPPSSFYNLDPAEQRVFLSECLGRLPNEEFEMLMAYVRGEGEAWSRKAGLQPGALRLRVHRIRRRLEELASLRARGSGRKES